ncbi:lytic transglycosylase domain-containing protein [Streptomyces albidoflavus]
MPAPRARRLPTRTRKGLRASAVAVAAMALLTASQAPGLLPEAVGDTLADEERAAYSAPPPAVDPPGDDAYHTELPPLKGAKAGKGSPGPNPPATLIRAQSGIPATVLRAYRNAERRVAGSDPGCRLSWELLAAIGKVESGHARGGAVDADGTTRGRITGPALDGNGFALIRDTDGGAHDGDTVYDRAVGPMQFLPSTWARWGADGNGDGRSDPNNIHDAALAAGHYLCAGTRDLGRPADLDRAILSYNYSQDYLRLVRHWMEFYRGGVHTVPDGEGTVPTSPGPGGKTPATRPVGDDGDGDGGIIVGPDPGDDKPGKPKPDPTKPGKPSPSPKPPTTPDPSPGPSEPPSESPDPSPGPSDPGTPTGPGTPTPPEECESPSPTPDPDESADPSPSPSPTDPACEDPAED